jgi:hypothetical protein
MSDILLFYNCSWTDFSKHCKETKAAVSSNIKPLHDLMKRNLTPEEARRMIPDRARAIRERQLTDTTLNESHSERPNPAM